MIKFKQHAETLSAGTFRVITATLVILTFPALLVASSQGLSHLWASWSHGLNSVLPPKLTWASLVAQRERLCLPKQETWVQSLGREGPLRKARAAHSSILAWEVP